MDVTLPGTPGFEPHPPRRAPTPARRLLGIALILAGLVLAGADAWFSARPGLGFSLEDGLDRPLLLGRVLTAVAGSALVIVGGRWAIDRDEPRLSRVPITITLVGLVLATVFLGRIPLLSTKFARSEHALTAAAQREMDAKLATEPPAAPVPWCTPAVDPAAFAAWVDDAQVCGVVTDRSHVIHIASPGTASPLGAPSRGLIYAPGATRPPTGGCINRLSPDWWEYSSLDDSVNCPTGLHFRPVV